MKILFLNHNVKERGGTYFRAFDVARYLAKRAHAVTLLSISPDNCFRFTHQKCSGVNVVLTPDLFWGRGRTGWDPWDVLMRLGFLCGKEWDIIHAWDSRPVVILPALWARALSGYRSSLVIDWCDWFGRGGTQSERAGRLVKLAYGPIETFFEEKFRTKADGNTVISTMLQQRARTLGVSSESILRLPQGCDIEEIRPASRIAARVRLKVKSDVQIMVSVGALMPGDANLLFTALRILFKKNRAVRFMLIGNHGARIPEDLLTSGRIVQTGFVSSSMFMDYTAASDMLVCPLANTLASSARWPSKINPFLAAGRAVLTTRVGDLPGLLEQTGAGLVVQPEPDALARGMLDMLASPDLRESLASRGRRLAEQELAWPVLVDKLENFYYRIQNKTSHCK